MVVGDLAGDHLRIWELKRENPNARDFIEGNWIKCRVEVKSGAFGGSVNVSLRAEAFATFRDQLRKLSQTLKGNASFIPMEPWVTINLKGDCRHELEALCLIRDNLDGGNEVRARIAVKAEWMGEMLEQLEGICEGFAVVGR